MPLKYDWFVTWFLLSEKLANLVDMLYFYLSKVPLPSKITQHFEWPFLVELFLFCPLILSLFLYLILNLRARIYLSNFWKFFNYLTSIFAQTVDVWLSWYSSCFRYQRSAVWTQSLAKLYLNWTFVYCQLCIEKIKIKKKRPGWPI